MSGPVSANVGVFDYDDSISTLTYASGSPIEIHAFGDVAFTGGCEPTTGPSAITTTCPIVFHRISLFPDKFSVPTPVGLFEITDVVVFNNDDQVGTQSGRGFLIPSEQIRMVANGYINGTYQTLLFTPNPTEDLRAC